MITSNVKDRIPRRPIITDEFELREGGLLEYR
jgi:hypothetical protein